MKKGALQKLFLSFVLSLGKSVACFLAHREGGKVNGPEGGRVGVGAETILLAPISGVEGSGEEEGFSACQITLT